MWKYPIRLFLLFASVSLAFTQSPNSWRGLVLDKSTIEDATAVLGDPEKLKDKQKLHTVIGDWMDKKRRYEKLEYKKLDKADKVLLFFSDGVLRAIDIDLETKVNPNSLENAYGIGFTPKVSGLAISERLRAQSGEGLSQELPHLLQPCWRCL